MEEVPENADLAPELHCVSELRVEVPLERRAELEHFYGELLGLVPWPAEYQIPGGVGFGDPRRGLYLQYRHDPLVDLMRRRFTLVVMSLDVLAKRLAEHSWPFQRYRGLGFTDQWLLVSDPVGHLIEVRSSQNIM